MSFDLLSEPIRRYVRDKRWEELRPIQNAAITKILSTDENYILASRTASGKTEAAFLPILSKVNFAEQGVQVLYISPLIALINDQFYRIEELCKYLDVSVTKWHGEAKKSAKEHLLKEPNGIVLITPESLEAMFVNKPHNVRLLFSNLKFVVIDEIHSFIGSDRGIQLKSILSRLQVINQTPFRIIGLSATLGDYNEAKKFTGNESNTKVLLDKTAKEIEARFRYFESKTDELPLDLLNDLYRETHNQKVLLFPNSRGRAEEVAVKLKKISERVNGHPNYFSHHSSVDKEVREYVEYFAKNNQRQNFCISCTSTLELGIDIGSVDEVVQLDATHSIASLIQRIGRSGRREGAKSNLALYATDPWSLLQSLACWLLYQEGFIDPPQIVEKPYDILLHQALSITKGHSGISFIRLKTSLKENFAFAQIEPDEIDEILNHLIAIDFLEKLGSEVIIGVEGEKVVNSRDFYSVFKTEENFKVINAGNTIGALPYSPQIKTDENILLAARIWKIKDVDFKSKKIEVVKSNDGKKPIFFGGGGVVHSRIREKMFEVLFEDIEYGYLDETGRDLLEVLRKDFSVFDIADLEFQRPLLTQEKKLQLFTFSGTRTNRTLKYLLDLAGISSVLNDSNSSFSLEESGRELLGKWKSVTESLNNIDNHLDQFIEDNPAILEFSKWGQYLPEKYQVKLLKERYFDFKGTEEFISSIDLVQNQVEDLEDPLPVYTIQIPRIKLKSHSQRDFIALDFETANSYRGSACSIGLAIYEDAQLKDEHHFLIKPKKLRFDPMNISIHGITQADILEAPEFDELYQSKVREMIDGKVVVAHNASFDISVLKYCLNDYDLAFPTLNFICSYRLSQKAFQGLGSYKLNALSDYLGIKLDHHNALSDAKACGELLLRALVEQKKIGISELISDLNFRFGQLGVNIYTPFR